MKINVPVSHLKAALCTAAKSDVRYWLVGVLIEASPKHTLTIATDGRALGAVYHEVDKNDPNDCADNTAVLIPRAACELAVKSARKDFRLLPLLQSEDGSWRLGDIRFTPIDGRYPDWRAAMPEPESAGEAAQFDVAILGQFRAASIALGNKKGYIHIHHRGKDRAAGITTNDPDYRGVIMPVKSDSSWTLPAWAVGSQP